MKKGTNKMLVIIIVLAMMVIAGKILNSENASAKEVKEEPSGRLTHVVVWLTENNEKDWNDGLREIEEAIREEYESMELVLTHVNNDGLIVHSIELTYDTEGGIVTGRIYDNR